MSGHVFGETIFEGYDSFYSHWFPAQADSAVYGIEVIAINGVSMSWVIETKKSEEPDSAATTLTTTSSINSTGVKKTGVVSGAKDLVRYKFDTGVTPSLDWIHFRSLEPSWQYN